MTTQHTQGRLESSHQFFSEGAPLFLASETGQIVARIENRVSGRPLTQEDAENARRLVACWNACEGISTEALEAVCKVPLAAVMLAEQRDELLEALKGLMAHFESGKSLATLKAVIKLDCPEARAAYAAIAKAEGGAT